LLQGRLTKLLGSQLEDEVFTELAVQTTKGIRVPDVALGSMGYVQKHIKDIYTRIMRGDHSPLKYARRNERKGWFIFRRGCKRSMPSV